MDFSSSQEVEFFDALEEILEVERARQKDGSIDSLYSDSMSLFRPASSEGESKPPDPAEEIPTMRLLSPSTEKSYVTVKALMEDVNKTTSRKGYNIVMEGGNRKDKNGDLRKLKLGCTKGGEYKENAGKVGEVGQERRQRRRQRMGCPFKAYASRKNYEWYLRVECPEYNHPPIAPEAFAANKKFSQADIVAIQGDARAHIPLIKTLARLHNLNPGKFFTIRDLQNQRRKLRPQDLAYLTLIQHLLQELQTSDLWFNSYKLDRYEQLTHLFFTFEPSFDLLEMYPDVLFVDCTYKTNKYNMPLYILSGITACNKSFYIDFAFLRHEDKDSYGWVMTQVKELYTRVGQEDGLEVDLTDKEYALIGNLHEIMPSTHHMLCVWHINKNIQARASKYISEKKPCQAWMELWHKVCQAATLAEYNQARAELEIADPPLIEDHRDSLFQYANREYLANGNNQKHCSFLTNGIRHFNKRVTSTAEEGHANIKLAIEST